MTDNNSIKIIRASNRDFRDIAAVEAENLSAAWSEKSLYDALDNEAYVYYIAVENGKTAASGGIRMTCGEAEITNVAVSKPYRRRGIASSILTELLGQAFSQGCESVFLEVASKNVPAIKLYEKTGFIKIGIRKNYYHDPSDDAILMKKTLK